MTLRSDNTKFKLDVLNETALVLPPEQKLCGYINGVWTNVSFERWYTTVDKYFDARKVLNEGEKVSIALSHINYEKGNVGTSLENETFSTWAELREYLKTVCGKSTTVSLESAVDSILAVKWNPDTHYVEYLTLLISACKSAMLNPHLTDSAVYDLAKYKMTSSIGSEDLKNKIRDKIAKFKMNSTKDFWRLANEIIPIVDDRMKSLKNNSGQQWENFMINQPYQKKFGHKQKFKKQENSSNFAKQNDKAKQTKVPIQGITCFNCSKQGHYARFCRFCNFCKRVCHHTSECPSAQSKGQNNNQKAQQNKEPVLTVDLSDDIEKQQDFL